MTSDVRDIMLAAFQAANYDSPLALNLAAAVRQGREDLEIEAFGLDSLGVMEFCISVELQSGLELTPMMVASMTQVGEIERWLRERL